jgi:hypothetical protein
MMTGAVAAVVVGIGATLFIDAWNTFLKVALGVPSLNYCLLGRWIETLPTGVFVHSSIAAAEPRRWECAMGWMAHYTIGVGLALLFVLGVAPGWLAAPTVLPALLYGIATVVLPFFVLQPALGLGIASSAARSPAVARAKSIATHIVYGLGLYVCGELVRWTMSR